MTATAGSLLGNNRMQYRNLRIDYCEDCGPNAGGYYCQVYRESDEAQIDDFCIHPDELTNGTGPEDIIRSYIDGMYDAYRREGLLEEPGFPQMTM